MMNFIFWLLWIIDLLLLGLIISGSGFRASFGASTDLNSWLTVIMIFILIGSMILRFPMKQVTISLIVAGLPCFVMLCLYLFEKKTKYE